MSGIMSPKVLPEGDQSSSATPRISRGVLRILDTAFQGYRRYVLVLALLAVLSALLDGLGINAIIPLVSFVLAGTTPPTDTITHLMSGLFGILHIPFTFRYLLV